VIRDSFNATICRTIESYWAARGYPVAARYEPGFGRCPDGLPIGRIVTNLRPGALPPHPTQADATQRRAV
jgi:hypothetical protein